VDKCVNEIIFLPKSARNNFLLTKILFGSMLIGNIVVIEYPLGCLLARSSSSFFYTTREGAAA
jgi:hypothetical protein